MKLVVFHTPPVDPATNTVFPDGSDGSTAMAPTRPAVVNSVPSRFGVTTWVGPTGVHVPLDTSLVGSVWKIRNPTDAWSAAGSPSPVPELRRDRSRANRVTVPV